MFTNLFGCTFIRMTTTQDSHTNLQTERYSSGTGLLAAGLSVSEAMGGKETANALEATLGIVLVTIMAPREARQDER